MESGLSVDLLVFYDTKDMASFARDITIKVVII